MERTVCLVVISAHTGKGQRNICIEGRRRVFQEQRRSEAFQPSRGSKSLGVVLIAKKKRRLLALDIHTLYRRQTGNRRRAIIGWPL